MQALEYDGIEKKLGKTNACMTADGNDLVHSKRLIYSVTEAVQRVGVTAKKSFLSIAISLLERNKKLTSRNYLELGREACFTICCPSGMR